MVPEQKLSALQERKELLVAQCDLHRGIIRVEMARTSESFGWIGRARQALEKARPWVPLAAPVVGFVLARNWRALLKLSGSSIGWKLIGQLLRL